jgi:nitrogen regulatory protein PII
MARHMKRMKLVTATVRPHTIGDVVAALARVGIRDVSVTEHRDYSQKDDGRTIEHTPWFRFLSMLKVEVLVPEDRAETTADIIGSGAKIGQPGGGKVFVMDVQAPFLK